MQQINPIIQEFFKAKAMAQGTQIADGTKLIELQSGLFEISLPMKATELLISIILSRESIQITTKDLLKKANKSEKYKQG